jgi:FkbM family methyltransferase
MVQHVKYLVKVGSLLYLLYKFTVFIKTRSRNINGYLLIKNKSLLSFIPEKLYSERVCSMDGVKAIPRKGTDDFLMLFIHESHESQIRPFLEMYENEVFVDIGANVGFYSLRMAHDYKDKGVKVLSIEAHPETYKALCRNINCNTGYKDVIVQTVNKAISDTKGLVTMYDQYEEYNGRHHFRYSSIYERVVSTPSLEVKGYYSKLQVECDTLDNILEHTKVDLMKIDIEGAEVQALRGATQTLGKLRRTIIEVHGNNLENVKRILEKNNFKVEVVGVGAPKHVIGTKCGDKIK